MGRCNLKSRFLYAMEAPQQWMRAVTAASVHDPIDLYRRRWEQARPCPVALSLPARARSIQSSSAFLGVR